MRPLPQTRMGVDEDLAWSEDSPGRCELVQGEMFAMAAERARHAMMVGPDRRTIVPHRRSGDGIESAFLQDGTLVPDPPGLGRSAGSRFEEPWGRGLTLPAANATGGRTPCARAPA